jgi:hypothetical protein
MGTTSEVVTDLINEKIEIWGVLVDDMRDFSYQYIPRSDGYVFKGTEEQAKNLFIKLFLEKYNEKHYIQPPFKTLKEYFVQEYGFNNIEDNEYTDEEIKKMYEDLYLLERSEEKLNGYMLFEKMLHQFIGINLQLIDIKYYL